MGMLSLPPDQRACVTAAALLQVRALREDAEKSARDRASTLKLESAKQAEEMLKMQTQFNAYSTAQHSYTNAETRSACMHCAVQTLQTRCNLARTCGRH